MRRIVSLACLTLIASAASYAAPAKQLPLLKSEVRTVAAFKNGLGFVFRSGTTPLQDGWAALDPIPSAVLGTLWIGTSSKGGSVSEVISYKDKVRTDFPALDLSEVLAANTGKVVTLTYSLGAGQPAQTVTGQIVSVPEVPKSDDLGPLPLRDEGPARYNTPRAAGHIVLLRPEQGGVLALNKSAVLTVQSPGQDLNTSVEREVNRAKVKIGGSPKEAEITVAYLEKGINWSPGYLLNIKDDAKAAITLEAVLANDAEDLEDTELSFVVGYPNFRFADIVTPLALQQSVAQIVERLGAAGRPASAGYGALSNVMAQSVNYAFDSSEWSPESSYAATTPMAGESNEDLYFYTQPGVTLKKGDRARYTVFTGSVPYEHVYEWAVPDTMSINEEGYRRDAPNNQDLGTQVWHSLRLTNSTDHPWTTAPAFVVNGPMPVAQDVLQYTPTGGKSTLKLTVATDVRAEQSQTEVSRTPVEITRRSFEEVVVDGKLSVKNWKKKDVRLIVTKSLVGEVRTAGQDGKVRKTVRSLTANNPSSEIRWEFDLPSGAEKELNYTYKALVAR